MEACQEGPACRVVEEVLLGEEADREAEVDPEVPGCPGELVFHLEAVEALLDGLGQAIPAEVVGLLVVPSEGVEEHQEDLEEEEFLFLEELE